MRGHIYLALELFFGSWFTLIALGTAWELWPKGKHAKRLWHRPSPLIDWKQPEYAGWVKADDHVRIVP